jgi:serine protease
MQVQFDFDFFGVRSVSLKDIRSLSDVLTLLLSLMVAALGPQPKPPAQPGAGQPDLAPVLIGFQNFPGAAEENLVRAHGGEVTHTFWLVRAIAARIPQPAWDALEHNPHTRYVEEDGEVTTTGEFGQVVPWGIQRVFGGASYPFGAWETTRGQINAEFAMAVAILDTGIDAAHEDLAGRVVGGVDIANGTEEWGKDVFGHGTHVAGTVAALDNELGVVGTAPGVLLYDVKVLNDQGFGSASGVAQGIEWAVEQGIPIMNMSLGFGFNQTMREMCETAAAAGHLLVASAGNRGPADIGSTVGFPGAYPTVIAVAASTAGDDRASFSSTGPEVELMAPGEFVWSTRSFSDMNYVTIDGMSYRASHITSAARTEDAGVTGELVDGGLALDADPNWLGKVVLVERGLASFLDKVKKVEASGGLAAVIYNNEPGPFSGNLGTDYSSSIPAIALSRDDGRWLLENELGKAATVVSVDDPDSPGYATLSGTSMASPHAAAIAALAWAANPALNNHEVRQLLQQSVEDMGLPPEHQGAGLVRADLATDLASPPPQTGHLTGTVSFSGQLWPGAVVVADGPRRRAAIAGEDGQFEMPNLPVGSYTVSAAAPGHSSAPLEGILIQQDQVVSVGLELQTAPPGSLLGWTAEVNESVKPVGGVWVTVEGTEFSAESNEDGFFLIEGIPASEYWVTAIGGTDYVDTSRRVRIDAGQQTIRNFVLWPRMAMTMVVADIRFNHRGAYLDFDVVVQDSFGNPLSGVAVEVNVYGSSDHCSTDPEHWLGLGTTTTNSDGAAQFQIWHHNRNWFYSVRIRSLRLAGYVADAENSVIERCNREEPPPPVEYNITISSTEGGSVTEPGEGTFIYDEGTVVDLMATANSGSVFAGWTGDTATIADVTASTTTITMHDDYSIAANFQEAEPEPSPGALAGNVTAAADGTALAGATVTVDATGQSATTGSDGSYHIGGIEPGTWDVTASATGYESATATATIESDQTTILNFALKLPDESESTPPSIDDWHLSENSNPRWARVRIDWAVSDADGNLASVVTVLSLGGEVKDSQTTSVSGGSATGQHDLRDAGGRGQTYTVTLTVTDTDGNMTQESKSIEL